MPLRSASEGRRQRFLEEGLPSSVKRDRGRKDKRPPVAWGSQESFDRKPGQHIKWFTGKPMFSFEGEEGQQKLFDALNNSGKWQQFIDRYPGSSYDPESGKFDIKYKPPIQTVGSMDSSNPISVGNLLDSMWKAVQKLF